MSNVRPPILHRGTVGEKTKIIDGCACLVFIFTYDIFTIYTEACAQGGWGIDVFRPLGGGLVSAGLTRSDLNRP